MSSVKPNQRDIELRVIHEISILVKKYGKETVKNMIQNEPITVMNIVDPKREWDFFYEYSLTIAQVVYSKAKPDDKTLMKYSVNKTFLKSFFNKNF